jgi:hypothetical protein
MRRTRLKPAKTDPSARFSIFGVFNGLRAAGAGATKAFSTGFMNKGDSKACAMLCVGRRENLGNVPDANGLFHPIKTTPPD